MIEEGFPEMKIDKAGGEGRSFKPSSARPLPSGVTACGVLWVGPGDLYKA